MGDPEFLSVSFADLIDKDYLTVQCSRVETDAFKLDPLTSLSQELESLEPELAAAFPSPPYSGSSPTMSSPTYSEDNVLDFQQMLSNEDPLFNGMFENIEFDLDNNENVNLASPPVNENVDTAETVNERIDSPSNHSETDSIPTSVAFQSVQGNCKTDSHPNEPVVIVEAKPKTSTITSQYTLRTRPQPTSEISGKKGPKVFKVEKQTVPMSRKRAASPSMSPEYECDYETDKGNKAAIQARINRQKKKAYIAGLETKVSDLTEENAELKNENSKLDKERNSLLEEVAYLKNVLANDSTLSGLLSNIGNVPNVRLTSSFKIGMENVAADHDYGKPAPAKRARKLQSQPMSSGVCLHVDNGNVSLEFCSKCAQMSAGAGTREQS